MLEPLQEPFYGIAHLNTAECSATVVPAEKLEPGWVFLSNFKTIHYPQERRDSNGVFKQIPEGCKKRHLRRGAKPERLFYPSFIGYCIAVLLIVAALILLIIVLSPLPASAWNIPGHMLSGAIAFQVLQQENPQTIEKVKTVLEKHPWHANQWQARLQDVSTADHGLVLFMQAARWADDIGSNDKQQHHALWHYINWPFTPDGQPPSAQTRA